MEKVSFILTTYNSGENLRLTIESILMQDYSAIEIVVKDGGSTDGTVDIIRSYEERLGKRLKWKSEPDHGIYDAMNQGYKLSEGEVLVFFNDVLISKDAVSTMMKAIEDGGPDCVGAHADLIYAEGDMIVREWKMGTGKFRDGWMPGHPTLYLKRQIYEKYGLYDTSYRCAADYEFMIRSLYGKEERLAYVPQTIVKMFYGGTSTGGLKNYFVSLREGHAALRKNHIKRALLVDLKRTVRVLRQFRR